MGTTYVSNVPTPGMVLIVIVERRDPPLNNFSLVSVGTAVSDENAHYDITIPCVVDPGQRSYSIWALEANGEFYPAGVGHSSTPENCLGPEIRGGPVRGQNPVLGESQNRGPTPSNQSVGCPVNTVNGNMWLTQTDYLLPEVGEPLSIRRTYNSSNQTSGLFSIGWNSDFDSQLYPGPQVVRLVLSEGQNVLFLLQGNGTFVPINGDFYGSLVKNTDNTFTVTFKDGRIHYFSPSGKLLWTKDRNGNQTTLTYDASNRLISLTDRFNRVLTVTTNTIGYISQIADSEGVVATYSYHPSLCTGGIFCRPLSSVTFADGSKHEFEYLVTTDNKVYLTVVKDALGNIVEKHEYDAQGRATTSERHGGVEKYTLDYSNWNAAIPFTTVTDALGRVAKYYFDSSRGRSVIVKTEGLCACGGSGSETIQYFYDQRANLIRMVDALSRETTFTYDSNGNRLSMTDNLGTETYTYNSLGQVLTATDRMGGISTNTYSPTGNLLTSKDPLNNTTTLTYTSIGQLQTLKDARNNTTTFTWDTQGRMTKVKDANDKETNFAYDGRARVTNVTNALNQTTFLEYDLNNRLKKIIHPDTSFVTMTYDLAGRRTGLTDELGHLTTYAYDSAYRLTGITNALNHSTTFVYDFMSNLTSQTDALGNVTNFEYDTFNRLKKTKYPLPTVGGTRLEENYTYDLVGNLKTRVDTAGRTTSYDYDTSYRLIKITDALNQMTQFEYNARSQMTKVKDALNQEYVFTYDPLGRVLSQTRAGSTMSFEYDAEGNRKKRTDYTGRFTHYTYDNRNRLTQVAYGTNPGEGGSSKQFTYDELSRLVSAINEAGTVSLTYDNRGRLKNETDVFGHVTERIYDAASRRTQLKLDGNVHTTYNYDNANRLTTLTDESSQNFTFGYDIANRLTSRTMPNGVTSTFEYDGMSRLTRLKHQTSSATLLDNQYGYNSANQISQIAELTQTKNFTYDNIDQLTGMTNGTSNESYVYNSVGNRTASHLSATYGYQPFNRLTSTTTSTQNIDPNGNTVSKSEGSNFWRYVWDYENKLATASNRKQTVRYSYDALGRRVRRNLNGGKESTKFTYDANDVIVDDNAGTLTKYQNSLGIDDKLKITANSTPRFLLADHLGSTNALTNSSGIITESNSYDSFGNSTNPGLSSRYQFTGREYDSFSGLQFSRARSYDPQIGRFTSEDPIGFEGGVNWYAYGRNNPNRFRDPFGLSPANPNIFDHLFGDGGIFTTQTFSEFFSAVERSKIQRKCKSTWTQRFTNNFYETNAALPGLGAPSIFTGIGLGALTSGATARAMNSMTVLQWAMEGFYGFRVGAATLSVAETGLTVAASTAVNAVLVTASYEAGVGIGSAVNATFGFSDYCPCGR